MEEKRKKQNKKKHKHKGKNSTGQALPLSVFFALIFYHVPFLNRIRRPYSSTLHVNVLHHTFRAKISSTEGTHEKGAHNLSALSRHCPLPSAMELC